MTVCIEAPWTDEQIADLKGYQECGYFHPYTCGGCDERKNGLRPTHEGWLCDACGYRQTWAHEASLNIWKGGPPWRRNRAR